MQSLRVLARGNILVLNVDHAKAQHTHGQRSYVGRSVVRAWSLDGLPKDCPRHEQYNEFLANGEGKIPHSAYPSTGVAVEVSNDSYYRKLVAKGALWPADKETADICGVEFDPSFGGELQNEGGGI